MTLAETLQEAMNRRGWSLRETARRLNISAGFLSNVLSGKRHFHVLTMNRVAQLFDLSYMRLLKLDTAERLAKYNR